MKKVYVFILIISLIILGVTIFVDVNTAYFSIVEGVFLIALSCVELLRNKKNKDKNKK